MNLHQYERLIDSLDKIKSLTTLDKIIEISSCVGEDISSKLNHKDYERGRINYSYWISYFAIKIYKNNGSDSEEKKLLQKILLNYNYYSFFSLINNDLLSTEFINKSYQNCFYNEYYNLDGFIDNYEVQSVGSNNEIILGNKIIESFD